MPRDNVFSSCYTVADYESRIARNGHPYKRLVLENAFENIPANCWSGSYIGPESFNIGDIVRISARRKTLDFRELCDIQHATLIELRITRPAGHRLRYESATHYDVNRPPCKQVKM